MPKTLIIILGPTGIGKTALSLELAKRLNTEIISADSRQIYKELQIGTATPNSQELNYVKHSFIKSHSIHDYYNASKFEFEVLEKLEELFLKKNNIIMTGGSMMYIDAVCNGIDDLPTIDSEIRNSLINKFEKEGIENLRLELKKIDPEYYSSVDLKNPKRILHALEVFYMTGKKYSSFRTNKKKERPFEIIKIGLNTDRAILHERINTRVDQMMAEGLLDEVKTVHPHRKLNSLNTVGYKELFQYLDGEIALETAVELIKRNSRRYARKQLTWFRKDETITWFEPSEDEKIVEFLQLKNIDF